MNQIKSWRLKFGRKQCEAADALAASYSKCRRWERGETPIPAEVLDRIKELSKMRAGGFVDYPRLATAYRIVLRRQQVRSWNSQGQ